MIRGTFEENRVELWLFIAGGFPTLAFRDRRFTRTWGIVSTTLLLAAGAAAQVRLAVPDSNAIMGFETPAGWIVSPNQAISTTLASTTARTQGNFALALTNPAELNNLTSLPVSSTATALGGIGNPGAMFEIDVMPPTIQGFSNRGSLTLSLSSRSRGLAHEPVGEVDFDRIPDGIYSTIQFPVPGSIAGALGNASFSDLVFEFLLSAPPGRGSGTYLLDNLRLHSVTASTGQPGLRPPPGYGGSVDFVVIGSTPVAHSFPVAALQVPDSLHLKLGTTGTTTVQLEIGYGGSPSFTCSYAPNRSDSTGKFYAISACSGVAQAGDLVGADWAQITIIGGDPSIKLRAQLAANPLGDMVGAGVIPAMPTFWGDFDSCAPAPVAGVVVTGSPSCASQTAEANQIVTAYFNKVNNAPPPAGWVVTPKPEFAQRYGNGGPQNHLLGPPPPPGDPPLPFDLGGHLNPGGSFDAYWRLFGMFDAENASTAAATQSTAHLDATLGGHVVLFGNDVDVVSVSAVIDASSGQGTFNTCDSSGHVKTSPDAFACFDVYLFGNQVFSQNVPGSVTLPNGVLFSTSTDLDLPPIPIWVFSITLGATASVELDLNNAKFAVTGFDVQLTPSAKLGAHVTGGIDIGIASGGVDARVDLLDVAAPLAAQAEWLVSTLPTLCSATPALSFSGQVNISSGGGEVDLVASFGPCPFCVDKSWNLFSWGPLAAASYPLFSVTTSPPPVMLPTALCSQPLQVTINRPLSTAALGLPILLDATVTSPNEGQILCGSHSGAYQPTWSVTSPDTLDTSAGQCQVTATFHALGQRSLSLMAAATFTDQFGRPITESSPKISETVNVTQLPPGPYIWSVSTTGGIVVVEPPGSPPPYNGDTDSSCGTGGGQVVTTASCPVFITYGGSSLFPVQLSGQVVGFTGNLCTNWVATPLNGTPSPIGSTVSGPAPDVTWMIPGGPGTYTITMATTDCNGHQLGTPATMQVRVNILM